jgi:hypothetical protein
MGYASTSSKPNIVSDKWNLSPENGKLIALDFTCLLGEIHRIWIISSEEIINAYIP